MKPEDIRVNKSSAYEAFRNSAQKGEVGIKDLHPALEKELITPLQYKTLLTDWTFGQEGLDVALAEDLIGKEEYERLSTDYINILDKRRI